MAPLARFPIARGAPVPIEALYRLLGFSLLCYLLLRRFRWPCCGQLLLPLPVLLRHIGWFIRRAPLGSRTRGGDEHQEGVYLPHGESATRVGGCGPSLFSLPAFLGRFLSVCPKNAGHLGGCGGGH
eukprot:scaffold24718_cov56-Phaeocystis_antarctica.AAC.5